MAGSGIFGTARGLRENLPTHGEVGELVDLRNDVKAAFAPLANITVVEYENAPAAATASVYVATATQLAARSVGAAGLVGGAEVVFPFARPISVTTAGATPASAPASVTVTGKDIDGKAQTEVISVPQTAATAVGTKCFKSVSKLDFTTSEGTDATVAVGHGAPLGLPITGKARAGALLTVMEVAIGARVTTGTLSSAATNAPHGMYTPAAAANGTNDYCILYEGATT